MPMPFVGQEFTFTQPDGTPLLVRGWGNQNYAVFETPDGYPVVQNPETGFYEYARVSEDGQALEPVGVQAGAKVPRKLGVKAGARVSAAAAKAMAAAPPVPQGPPPRWRVRRENANLNLRMSLAAGPWAAPPKRGTIGAYTGLCLLIEFPDVPATITREEADAFLNDPGYAGFGNQGSVYDYFRDVSGGKVQYNCLVTPYYKAKNPSSYYKNPAWPWTFRTQVLIREALAGLGAIGGVDFASLSTDNDGFVYALNVFYAGPCTDAWCKGLWPHSSSLLLPVTVAPGKRIKDYQITDMGGELRLATYCHENGHMLCDFPDLYDYGNQSSGSGVYCLMAGGASHDGRRPTLPAAYLRYRAGWANSVSRVAPGSTFALAAGTNDFVIHQKNLAEYFIIENRSATGRDSVLTDSGLAIWHVDELASNNNEQMTSKLHYECALEQADGRFDLEKHRNDGDRNDLFKAGGAVRFSDTTRPASKWWDGKQSGLDVRDIGPAGPVMNFSADCA